MVPGKALNISAIMPNWIAVVEQQRARGNSPAITESSNFHVNNEKDEWLSSYAIVHPKFLKRKGDLEKTNVEIRCPTIQAVVRKVIGRYSYPGIQADPIVFIEPCYPLFQFKQEFSEHAGSQSISPGKRERLVPLMD